MLYYLKQMDEVRGDFMFTKNTPLQFNNQNLCLLFSVSAFGDPKMLLRSFNTSDYAVDHSYI